LVIADAVPQPAGLPSEHFGGLAVLSSVVPVAQTSGLTDDEHIAGDPSVHLDEPALVSAITFLSTPDESLIIVVSLTDSLAVEPSAQVDGFFLSEHNGIEPSEHFGGVPLAVPVGHVPGAFLSVQVGALPSLHKAGPL